MNNEINSSCGVWSRKSHFGLSRHHYETNKFCVLTLAYQWSSFSWLTWVIGNTIVWAVSECLLTSSTIDVINHHWPQIIQEGTSNWNSAWKTLSGDTLSINRNAYFTAPHCAVVYQCITSMQLPYLTIHSALMLQVWQKQESEARTYYHKNSAQFSSVYLSSSVYIGYTGCVRLNMCMQVWERKLCVEFG